MSGRRLVGIGALTIGLMAGILLVGRFVYVPFIGGEQAIHDQASLPGRLHVCGRTWTESGPGTLTDAEIVNRFGEAPTLIDPRLFAPCPNGVCAATADGPCHTVVFARVAEDRHVAYSLSAGP